MADVSRRLRSHAPARLVGLLLACLATPAAPATTTLASATGDVDVGQATRALLSFLSFSVIPDSTADSLEAQGGSGNDARILLTQVGDGDALPGLAPLYLEGYLGYARFDPYFVVTGEEGTGIVQARWQTFAATGGIGYDFTLADHWVLRPIANLSLAHMTSSAGLENLLASRNRQPEGGAGEWLADGWLNAGAVGGSLVLDYANYQPGHEIDLELRYSHYYLGSLDSSLGAIEGTTHSNALGLWTRLRVPTGITALDRPLRAVFDAASSWFANDLTRVLGFEQLSKVGAGLELDLGARDSSVQRLRIVGRYAFGGDVSGVSLGLGVSF